MLFTTTLHHYKASYCRIPWIKSAEEAPTMFLTAIRPKAKPRITWWDACWNMGNRIYVFPWISVVCDLFRCQFTTLSFYPGQGNCLPGAASNTQSFISFNHISGLPWRLWKHLDIWMRSVSVRIRMRSRLKGYVMQTLRWRLGITSRTIIHQQFRFQKPNKPALFLPAEVCVNYPTFIKVK